MMIRGTRDTWKKVLHSGVLHALAITGTWVITSLAQVQSSWAADPSVERPDLEPLRFRPATVHRNADEPNNTPATAGFAVDLGVGLWAWPLPMDFDGDGDLDLVVGCPDRPFNGTYFFENPSESNNAGSAMPVFRAPRRISKGMHNVQVSYIAGQAHVLTPAAEYPEFRKSGLDTPRLLGLPADFHERVGQYSDKIRASQWKYVDYNADGALDVIVGIGDWSDYGWDDAYDAEGRWTHGPLHGFVYLFTNLGTNASSSVRYADPVKLTTSDGAAVDVYGWPSPNLEDFDGDGDLDLLCGEFLDGFTYFKNVGSRSNPRFEIGRKLHSAEGGLLQMDLQMIVPAAIDWDRDGDVDLIVGDEDGRVAFVEHSGVDEAGLPEFKQPKYFQQEADLVKCGALSTPCCVDWDSDGDADLLSGNTAGYVIFFENQGRPEGACHPAFAAGQRLKAAGKTLRIQAGPNGSIQGPCEAKWGYTTISAADWDHDGLIDLIANSIWGRVQWYRNIGTASAPRLGPAQDIRVQWHDDARDKSVPPKPAWTWWQPTNQQLVTQWRTTPVAIDWTQDGLVDLVMLDPEGYLVLYERTRSQKDGLQLQPPKRVFRDTDGNPLRLNERTAGGSGRRKLCVVDWNQDGLLDVIVNGKNADWYRQAANENGQVTFEFEGPIAKRFLSSHTTSPTTVDWNENDVPDLLIGAEDGHFYYLPR